MNIQNLDSRIVELLKSRGYQTEQEINDFLFPKVENMLNPFDLDGMAQAKERIETAIKNQEKIAIYGDYDCDGISACVILYKYFLSRGVKTDVYIPDRFDDGYGLSFDMIDEIAVSNKPDLIITVDLGVTAVDEVEKVKGYGIDIIVTDHHEPLEVLPDCVVIDPKKQGQKYAFNGLCGAGVALKLVEALSGREEAVKYFDVCAVATIGDIVPLVSENRIIAKLGIEMLNSSVALKSYRYMFNQLGIENISGTDVTFKIVPRINASGRMSNAKKVFDFLIEEDDEKLKIAYQNMALDNESRLQSITEGMAVLEEQIKSINLAKDNIILLQGDFHQGVLGILASRICHDYNRPTIIFTKTEEGTLKGSGRSLEQVDMHSALQAVSEHLVRFGGHKMAIGVEVMPEKFETIKKALSVQVAKQVKFRDFLTSEKFDIAIKEKDINKNFINELHMLEPFGCQNEKPTLMLETGPLNVTQMKDNNFKHFKVTTKTGKQIVAFSSEKHIDTLKSNVRKHLIIELENNYFKGKVYPQAILKDVYIKDIFIDKNRERETIVSLLNMYSSMNCYKQVKQYEINEIETLLKSFDNSEFGTIVVVDSYKIAEKLKEILPRLKSFSITHIPFKNKQNAILVNSKGVQTCEELSGYVNVVFTRCLFKNEKNIFTNQFNVYAPRKLNAKLNIDVSRQANINIYNLLKKYKTLVYNNNIFEWVDKLETLEGGFDKIQFVFSSLVFDELSFVDLSLNPFMLEVKENPPKKELNSSKFLSKFMGK